MARISMNELPLRPKKLSADDLDKVFGGCSQRSGYCMVDCDCCNYGAIGMNICSNPYGTGGSCWG